MGAFPPGEMAEDHYSVFENSRSSLCAFWLGPVGLEDAGGGHFFPKTRYQTVLLSETFFGERGRPLRHPEGKSVFRDTTMIRTNAVPKFRPIEVICISLF